MALLNFPGSDRLLAAHGSLIPQPDQLCGPFSARVALHAVLAADQVPPVGALAAASGTAIWPHDVEEWRPDGAPLDRTGWDELLPAPSIEASGTTAAGVVTGLKATVGDRVAVVAIPGTGMAPSSLRTLLTALLQVPHPVGLVANLLTGPVAPQEMVWDVGHFVVLSGLDPEADEVVIADTYAELGRGSLPAGCRTVPLAALAAALSAPPGRGLVVVVPSADRTALEALVSEAGLTTGVWET